ncbi:MAG: putative cell surface polysaccharide biosynthesis, partial [Pseudarthrobacter sp.]|nr:putative cell surface polysaccharide biosynthesis [Pseudarthrobacter sp.]
MEFNEYGRHIRRNWVLLVTCALLGILAAGLASALMSPVYKSTTKLFVGTQSSGSVEELQQGNNFTQQRVQSYVLT